MGGTLTKGHRVVAAASTPACWVGWNVVVVIAGDSPSTLLGPEATGWLSCGRVAGVSGGTGRWVAFIPAGLSPGQVFADGPGGFVRCLRTA